MRQGNIPSRVDVVVVLERLAEVVEHDDANLTATAQAGMKVAAFQEIVGRRRQHLAVDPPHPARATLGGIVAANRTLGIVTEVTVRVTPLPERLASFLVAGSLDRCVGFADRLSLSSLLPAAVTIVSSEAAKRIGCDSEVPVVAIGVEGRNPLPALSRNWKILHEPAISSSRRCAMRRTGACGRGSRIFPGMKRGFSTG
jgi:glycolate oxidase FAD binding subunit